MICVQDQLQGNWARGHECGESGEGAYVGREKAGSVELG